MESFTGRILEFFLELAVCGVLQGFLGKTDVCTWCFCGEVVVECVVNVVC
jgi:hypothetical protein